MRVLVVGSCSKKKLYHTPRQPTCHDIDTHSDINYWRKALKRSCAPARVMYIGPQTTELVGAVDLLRRITSVEVQLVIISAGFGVLQEQDLVPPYDCSFTNMRIGEVQRQSRKLKLKSSFEQMTNKGFDLIYLALGKQYLTALGEEALSKLETTTVMFHGLESDHLIRIPCSSETVHAFSKQGHKIHGVVGFKGDLLRILARYALGKSNPSYEVKKWTNPIYLKKLALKQGGIKNTN